MQTMLFAAARSGSGKVPCTHRQTSMYNVTRWVGDGQPFGQPPGILEVVFGGKLTESLTCGESFSLHDYFPTI